MIEDIPIEFFANKTGKAHSMVRFSYTFLRAVIYLREQFLVEF